MNTTTLKNYSDEQLIALFQKSNDNDCLGVLLDRHTLLLLGLAMKFLKDKEKAQDAVQQVFIKVIQNFPEAEIQNFKGWLYILMRNYCFSYLKQQTHFADPETIAYQAAPEPKTQEDWLHNHHIHQHIHKAIHHLNAEQALCIRLFYLEEKTYKQIIEQTNFSFENVKSYIQNGKRNLKIALLKLGINTSHE